jgi:hypothetical protein
MLKCPAIKTAMRCTQLVKQAVRSVLFSSGNWRRGRYLRNAGGENVRLSCYAAHKHKSPTVLAVGVCGTGIFH